jgi:hypothetical protein
MNITKQVKNKKQKGGCMIDPRFQISVEDFINNIQYISAELSKKPLVPEQLGQFEGLGPDPRSFSSKPLRYRTHWFDSLSTSMKYTYYLQIDPEILSKDIHLGNYIYNINTYDELKVFIPFTCLFKNTSQCEFSDFYFIVSKIIVEKLLNDNNINDIINSADNNFLLNLRTTRTTYNKDLLEARQKQLEEEGVNYDHDELNTIYENLNFIRYMEILENVYFPLFDNIYSIKTISKAYLQLGFYYNIPMFSDGIELHSYAIIYWREGEILHYGIYDPMYHIRTVEGRQVKNFYESSLLTQFYINLWAKDRNIKLHFHDINEKCARTEKGVHCVQYIMNAEYCLIYSSYFLLLIAYLISTEGTITDAIIEKAVHNTFTATDHLSLRKENIQTLAHFQITMGSFIVTLLTLYTISNMPSNTLDNNISKRHRIVSSILNYIKTFYNITNINILYEPLRPLLKGYIENSRKDSLNSQLVDYKTTVELRGGGKNNSQFTFNKKSYSMINIKDEGEDKYHIIENGIYMTPTSVKSLIKNIKKVATNKK